MRKLISKIILASKVFHQPPLTDHIRYFGNRIFLKKKPPYMGIIGLTYRCPCHCAHCMTGAENKESVKDELSTSEVLDMLKKFRNLGVLRVLLFGGEPFMRKDILDIISYADNYNFVVAVDSNGYYITSEIADHLKKIKRLEIAISLDSHVAAEHDRMRQCRGLFSKAVQSIRLLADRHKKVFVSTFLSRERLKNGTIDHVVTLAKQIGASGVRLLVPVCTGRWFYHTKESLTLRERDELRSAFNFRFVFLSDPYSFVFEQYPCCAALKGDLVYVSPYGDVQPCSAMPISFGNIREEPFEKIVSRMMQSRMMNSSYNDCPMNDAMFRRGFPDNFNPANDKPLPIAHFNRDAEIKAGMSA